MTTVLVIGAAGAVGTMLADLVERGGQRVTRVDCRPDPGRARHQQWDILTPPPEAEQLCAQVCEVILALPEAVAVKAIPWLATHLAPDATLIPTCSVQAPFFNALKRHGAPQRCAGINPMFSPSLGAEGRPVAICVEADEQPVHWIEGVLVQAGMKLHRMLPTTHDELMARCQALPHAAILAFGLALANSKVDLKLLATIAPPPMRMMMALLSRVLVNPAQVYWDIQSENDHAKGARAALRVGLEQVTSIVDCQQEDEFCRTLETVAQALGEQLPAGAEQCHHLFGALNEFDSMKND